LLRLSFGPDLVQQFSLFRQQLYPGGDVEVFPGALAVAGRLQLARELFPSFHQASRCFRFSIFCFAFDVVRSPWSVVRDQ
jgi:hypothetical protein